MFTRNTNLARLRLAQGDKMGRVRTLMNYRGRVRAESLGGVGTLSDAKFQTSRPQVAVRESASDLVRLATKDFGIGLVHLTK